MGNQKQTADKSNAEGSQQAIEEMVELKSIFTIFTSNRRNGRFEINILIYLILRFPEHRQAWKRNHAVTIWNVIPLYSASFTKLISCEVFKWKFIWGIYGDDVWLQFVWALCRSWIIDCCDTLCACDDCINSLMFHIWKIIHDFILRGH